MSVIKPTTVPTKVLAESINASATSFKLNNIKGWDAADLVSGDFGITVYAVFRNSTNTAMELMEIDPTTIASTSITITRRGLQFDGDLTTEVTANKLTWNKGDTFVDIGAATPQLWQWLKEYIDAASIAGAVPAANATAGIIKIATATELNADTEDDGTYDYVPNPATLAASKYGTRLPSADEKAAMAGGDELGTPSTTNKYLTEAVRTQVVEFTASGTWTKDTGLQRIRVQAWGGGGSGAADDGGGGGGGGYFEAWFEADELGATETVTVGAGGVGVLNGNGNAGANTTFGSLVTAYGGSGGIATPGSAGGDGGDIQAGSTLFRGAGGNASTGGVGIFWGGGGGGDGDGGTGAGGNALFGGAGGGGSYSGGPSYAGGGTSIYGGNGGASGAVDGTVGSVPGGGGGASNTGTSGAGAAGKVIVTEYYI